MMQCVYCIKAYAVKTYDKMAMAVGNNKCIHIWNNIYIHKRDSKLENISKHHFWTYQ